MGRLCDQKATTRARTEAAATGEDLAARVDIGLRVIRDGDIFAPQQHRYDSASRCRTVSRQTG